MGKNHKLYGNLFLNRISNLINTVEIESTTATRLFSYENIDQAISRGLELGITSRLLPNILARVNFSYTETFNEASDLLLANRPLYLGMASLKADLSKELDLILMGRYQGAMFVDEENLEASPEFATIDMRLNYQWNKNLRIFGSFNNILNNTRSANEDVVTPVFDNRPVRGQEVFFGLRASL